MDVSIRCRVMMGKGDHYSSILDSGGGGCLSKNRWGGMFEQQSYNIIIFFHFLGLKKVVSFCHS